MLNRMLVQWSFGRVHSHHQKKNDLHLKKKKYLTQANSWKIYNFLLISNLFQLEYKKYLNLTDFGPVKPIIESQNNTN